MSINSLIRKYPVMSVAVACMLVFFGVMMLPGGGAAGVRAKEAKSLKNAHEICIACRDYSRAHTGHFPPTFDTLFPQYLQDRSVLVSPLSPSDPVGYIYTPPVPERVDSPDTVVIEDKYAPSIAHERIVIYANASGGVLTGT